MAGTVNISRDLWDDTAFAADPFSEREAWVWLIAEASWKPRVKRVGDHVVDLARGQLAHSTRFLAETWGWTHSKARRYLDRLEKLKLIERQTGTGVSVITICKYDKYQSPAQTADTGPAQDRHRTGTNEKKGEIRGKEGRHSSAPIGTGDDAPTSRFEDFWSIYPHRNGAKKDRQKAEASYAKAVKSGVPEQAIIAGATRYQSDRQVLNGYAKNPATWLNNRCWNDEVEPAANIIPLEGSQHGRLPQRARADFDHNHREYTRRLAAGQIDRGPDPSDPFGGR